MKHENIFVNSFEVKLRNLFILNHIIAYAIKLALDEYHFAIR